MTRRCRLMPVVALLATCAVAVAGCTGGPAAPGGTASPTVGTATSAGNSTGSLTSGGVDRTYRLSVPPTTATAGAVPLLVALHGGGGSGAHFEQISGFDQLAVSNRFIVAYPDAIRPPSGQVASWNAGDCCGWAARTHVDDVGFIHTLIDTLSAEHRIDAKRIFIAGFSNGGMLAYRIGCQLAGTVAAIGVQSATLEYSPCHPAQPVSLLHIHGTADTQIPLAGGRGTGRSVVDFSPPPQAAATIAAADGCNPAPGTGPDRTLVDARLRTWTGCPPGIGVQFVTVDGLEHTWMATSAAQIWTFLAAHARSNP